MMWACLRWCKVELPYKTSSVKFPHNSITFFLVTEYFNNTIVGEACNHMQGGIQRKTGYSLPSPLQSYPNIALGYNNTPDRAGGSTCQLHKQQKLENTLQIQGVSPPRLGVGSHGRTSPVGPVQWASLTPPATAPFLFPSIPRMCTLSLIPFLFLTNTVISLFLKVPQ